MRTQDSKKVYLVSEQKRLNSKNFLIKTWWCWVRFWNITYLEKLNKNIKSIDASKKNQISKLDSERNGLLSARSRDFETLKTDNELLKKENMRYKLEVRIYESVFSMHTRLSPTFILYVCINYMKKCYAMYTKAKVVMQLTNKFSLIKTT